MIRAFKFTFQAAVVLVWLFLAFVVIDWIGQQIEFHRALGGMF